MKKLLLLSALALFSFQMSAQMADIGVTLQPTISYNWFDKNTAIDDGVMLGGRVGFGFGEAIEIRALYERSVNIQNTIRDLDFASEEFLTNFTSRDVKLERIGGEFKANIPTRGTFVPYFTFGAGVQKLTVNVAEDNLPEVERRSDQIFANLGVGTQIRLTNRIFLNLEIKNTVFNLDPADVLYREGTQSGVGDWLDDREDRMFNWSALAGLQFYLGGREPGSMTELDRAYYRKFSGGLSGLKLVLEPGGSYINFNDNSNLKDTYLLGGKVGLDLNQFIGLRAFYYRATMDQEISTTWDDLAIYGGDIVAKLNVSRGIVPYLELGGGYLNVYEGYQGVSPILSAPSSGYFAKGGAGLSIPITKNLEAFGSASLMYVSQRAGNELENIVSPSELKRNTIYNAGIRIQLGRSANTEDILEDRIDARVNARTNVYENRIQQLERELQSAYNENDTEKAVAIIEEKKLLENEKMRIEAEDETGESRIRMTPAELEKLIERVIQGVDDEQRRPATIEERIDRLERLLLELSVGSRSETISPAQQDLATDRIIKKIDELNSKIDNNARDIDRLANNQSQDRTVVVTPGGTQPQVGVPSNITVPPNLNTQVNGVGNQNNEGIATGFFVNEGVSLFGGYVIGDGSAGLVGIRGHYSITNSRIKFMPDLYVAPGSDTGFGLNANALLSFDQFSTNLFLEPYIGLGFGYNNVGDFDKFGTNLIIGTSFNLLGGNIYADYTARNFIDMHQISVGYRFGF